MRDSERELSIGGRTVGAGRATLVVAEVAQAHDGSLGNAHQYARAAARAGAGAIKFQTHIADAESTPDEPWRIKFSVQDETRYAYWRRMEFTEAQWQGLAERAKAEGLLFLSSAFSEEAVDLLERVGVAGYKVGAGEITNLPLLERIAKTKKPAILSSGMSTWEELDRAVETVRKGGSPCAVLQCTSSYPTPPEKLGLNVIAELAERYGCTVGLSDHSGNIYAGLAAAALGANIIETHVVFSRDCFGPDTTSSVTIEELGRLVEGVRFIDAALAHPVEKNAAALELGEMKRIFEKSVVLRAALPAGAILRREDLTVKKPGSGIPAARLGELVGRRLTRQLAAGAMLGEDDLE